jgi:7,8-dihydroneopterin aldolase/epimerase/oxygenase
LDVIEIRGIQAKGKHGASEAERQREQLLNVDVSVSLDLTKAASSDSLEQTINYATLRDRLVHVVQEQSFHLLERLAAELLAAIFEDVRVVCAEVWVAKPSLLDGATPCVHLCRRNPRYIAP